MILGQIGETDCIRKRHRSRENSLRPVAGRRARTCRPGVAHWRGPRQTMYPRNRIKPHGHPRVTWGFCVGGKVSDTTRRGSRADRKGQKSSTCKQFACREASRHPLHEDDPKFDHRLKPQTFEWFLLPNTLRVKKHAVCCSSASAPPMAARRRHFSFILQTIVPEWNFMGSFTKQSYQSSRKLQPGICLEWRDNLRIRNGLWRPYRRTVRIGVFFSAPPGIAAVLCGLCWI
jgi:hypothetical protein